MNLKRIFTSFIVLALTAVMLPQSAFSLALSTRRAGVSQNYANSYTAYSSSKVKTSNGLRATEVGGHIIYRLYDDITTAFISVSDGEDSLDFRLSVSSDGSDYKSLIYTRKSKAFVMNGKSQVLYEYSSISSGQKFIKIEFLTEQAAVNGAYVNIDAEFTPYGSICELAFKDNSGANQNASLMDDFKAYKEKVIKSLQTTVGISAILDSMNADGSWSSIVYDGETTHAAYSHFDKVNTILKAVSTPANKSYKDADIIAKAVKSIDFWLNKNITFTNWYYNGIVVPGYVGQSLLVSADVLPMSTQKKLENYMKSKVSYIDSIALRDAGSNIVHEMQAKIYYALYTDDLQMLLDCFDRINMEIIIVDDMSEDQDFRDNMWRGYVAVDYLPATKEGIQADYSALFHGPLIYSGGYGQVMVALVAPMLAMTDGTELFPQTGLQVLADHILEHYAYVTRGNTICFSTVGRQISTAAMKSGNTTIIKSTEELLKLKNVPRREELQAFVDAAQAGSNNEYLKADYPAVAVEASAEPENTSMATNAIDGDLTTRWASNNATDHITVDLGEAKRVGSIGIAFYMGTTRKSNFELHVSTDNLTWTEICSGQGSGTINGYEYFVFEPREVRYIRVTGHGNTSNEWNSINEISAFEGISTDAPGAYGESYVYIDDIGIAKRYMVAEAEPMPKPAVTGHKHFWKADFTGHAKEKFLTTIRAASRRTIGGEALNTQNLKGNFLGDGATMIYRTGTEYDDIFVAWDWHKIPGTTVETHPFDDITSIQHHFDSSESYRINGVSDGNNGATAMELIHDTLSAKKAWFMFDNEFMALGADVKLGRKKYSAITTVNQSLLKSNAVVGTSSGSSTVITDGSAEKQNALWVWQDRIGYVFENNTPIHISAKKQSGDRYDINWGGAVTRPERTDIVSKNVFSVWFDHTNDNTDTYQYTVVPDVSQTELEAYAADRPLRVISNTGKLQAVENSKTGEKQAVFWTAGLAQFSDMTVECDKEVLIAVSGNGEEQKIAVASLEQKVEQVKLKITQNGETKEFTVDLPGDRYAGSSIIVNINSSQTEE